MHLNLAMQWPESCTPRCFVSYQFQMISMMHMVQWMNWIHTLRLLKGKTFSCSMIEDPNFLNLLVGPSLIDSTSCLVIDISRVMMYYRLDSDSMNGLPDHCKMCFSTTLNVFSEFDEEIIKQGSYYDVSHLKEAVCTPTNLVKWSYAKACLLEVALITFSFILSCDSSKQICWLFIRSLCGATRTMCHHLKNI